jgi:tetratricopeptide (TPR) repeat protein
MARPLLQLFQCLHASAIPRAFLEVAHRRVVRNGMVVVLASMGDTGFDASVRALAAYALASVTEQLVTVHPLLAAATQLALGAPSKTAVGFVVELTGGLMDPRLQVNLELSRAMAVHHVDIIRWLERAHPDSVELVGAVRSLGLAEQATEGNAALARDLLERALALQVRLSGSEPPELARTILALGLAYAALGDTPRAKAMFERALPLLDKAGNEPELVATATVALADAHGVLGSPEEHRTLAERALAQQEQRVGTDHVSLCPTLLSLARAAGALGDARRQKELLERALPLQEAHYGADHGQVSETLAALGLAYTALNEATQKRIVLLRERKNAAQQMGTLASVAAAYAAKQRSTIERALEIGERRFGKEHPAVAPWVVQVAEACTQPAEAGRRRALLERAVAMQERAYGPEDPRLVLALTRLGALQVATVPEQPGSGSGGGVSVVSAPPAELVAGRATLERALALQERMPATAPGAPAALMAILRELEEAYRRLKLVPQRRIVLERLVGLMEAEKDRYADDPVLAAMSFTLGDLLVAANELEPARRRLERTLVLQDRPALRDSVDVGPTLVMLGNLYYRLKTYDLAVRVLERALAYQEQNYGTDHLVLVPTLTNLGATLLAQRLYRRARPLMERAMAIEEKRYGTMHVNVLQIRTSLLTIPPHQHPLGRVLINDYKCNLCAATKPGPQPAYHCGECNYDECGDCFGESGSKEKVGVTIRAAESATNLDSPDTPPALSGRKPIETFLMDDDPVEVRPKKGGAAAQAAKGNTSGGGGCCVAM